MKNFIAFCDIVIVWFIITLCVMGFIILTPRALYLQYKGCCTYKNRVYGAFYCIIVELLGYLKDKIEDKNA